MYFTANFTDLFVGLGALPVHCWFPSYSIFSISEKDNSIHFSKKEK